MSQKKPEITFKYVFNYGYNPSYVNGAQGGFSPRGEMVINFYLERQPLPEAISHEITPEGAIGRETASEPKDLAQSMVRFIDDVDHPAVRANIDISHLELAHVKPEELRRLKGKAIHVHLSDCDGKVHGDLPPGRGVMDFTPYLREIKALGIDGAISIELEYSPQPDKIADWVREAYTATDRLMQKAGLRG